MERALILTLLFLVACTYNNISSALEGKYSEISPVKERTQLEFIGNKVVKSETGNPARDVFYYQISGNSIKLIPAWDNSEACELSFSITSQMQFTIENLYQAYLNHLSHI